MTSFWLGFLTAIASYFAIGFVIGIVLVFQNLARFHGGGFQWMRMIQHIGVVTLMWPMAVLEIFA